MKHTIRSFSIGLIAAGIILLTVYFFFDGGSDGETEYSTEELIAQIEADGYRVITEEEYISFSVATSKKNDDEADQDEEKVDEEENADDEDNEENDNEDSDEEEEDEVEEAEDEEEETSTTVTITVEPGMASSQISQMLEEEGIIDDAGKFSQYLIEHDYHMLIQLGEHELETGMSHYEIAEELTN